MPETLYVRKTNIASSKSSSREIRTYSNEPKPEAPVTISLTTDQNSSSDTGTEEKASYRRSSDGEIQMHSRTQHIKGRPSRKQFALFFKPSFFHSNLKVTFF